jgi:hypothetical protein
LWDAKSRENSGQVEGLDLHRTTILHFFLHDDMADLSRMW